MERIDLGFRRPTLLVIGLVALLAVACGGDKDSSATDGVNVAADTPETAQAGQATVVPPVSPAPTPTPSPLEALALPRTSTVDDSLLPDYIAVNWPNTDFSKHSVPFFEIISGGVGRDGIPPIDDPIFLNASDDPEYMEDDDPVIALEVGGEAKAYPLDILQSHEIVNDELGGIPVTVTYCPLCNTAVVFDRRVDGRVFDFGVSGNLRNSD
ncbi:MAG: DUF3179 domain-containing protein, partial [Proteobacteria bacterium]|nr:DUF3179 domain-containing protein [Pseudomonadota bacterium]